MRQLTTGELHLGSTIDSQVDEIFLDVAVIINIFQVLPERVQDPVVTGFQLFAHISWKLAVGLSLAQNTAVAFFFSEKKETCK